ncbi:Protein of unknown function [Cotesia congregata]|uniref:Uncharacterized protein n=1 Tax=Cotesia congregata TaxID=51543 RepID=A0A8J2E1C4_COTCN|nr:Protein of unknown function [Cotesia congregata]
MVGGVLSLLYSESESLLLFDEVLKESSDIALQNPSKWGKNMLSALKEMGCEEIAGMIYNKDENEKIEEKIDAGIERYKERLKEEDKKAIERSTYNKIYKRIMIEEDEYNY